ncbi:uncharacterized protein LOC142877297 [Nelusetta ayraudi]|uniref:uncharacterized protein LOC142877297 n=1 Tax=Nelusetta ayraudi TaxID=303726 RepID=UPI003F71B172
MKTLRLAGVLLLLLLPATVVGAPQDPPPTSTPEYDYNPTFDYSFFSNVTSDDYDNFTDLLLPTGAADPQETAGPSDQPGSAIPTTSRPPAPPITEWGGATVPSAASLPVSAGSRALLFSLLILITPQLQHTG